MTIHKVVVGLLMGNTSRGRENSRCTGSLAAISILETNDIIEVIG